MQHKVLIFVQLANVKLKILSTDQDLPFYSISAFFEVNGFVIAINNLEKFRYNLIFA